MFRYSAILIITLTAIFVVACELLINSEKKVKTGAEVLIERHLGELENRSVGLLMNPTARIGETHMLDTLLALDVNVTALYAPEHGFRGEAGAGEIIEDGVDLETGLPVYSLYGETRQPTAEMLEEIDLLLFDIQDVGARFYTYNSTLGLAIEAAARNDVEVWVLDRPNPAGGDYVSGWIMEQDHMSFVGMYPIPVAHGMTLGELGGMMVGEEWIRLEQEPNLRVITMDGWERQMKWPDTGLEWIPPSPNLPTFEHAYVYLGTCLVEGTSLSEGRGTEGPFLLLGAPETSIDEFDMQQLNSGISGVNITQEQFSPKSIPGKAINPKHEGEVVNGIRIEITDYNVYDPVDSGLRILAFLMDRTPGAELNPFIYRLAGTEKINDIQLGEQLWWEFDGDRFLAEREPYLLYD